MALCIIINLLFQNSKLTEHFGNISFSADVGFAVCFQLCHTPAHSAVRYHFYNPFCFIIWLQKSRALKLRIRPVQLFVWQPYPAPQACCCAAALQPLRKSVKYVQIQKKPCSSSARSEVAYHVLHMICIKNIVGHGASETVTMNGFPKIIRLKTRNGIIFDEIKMNFYIAAVPKKGCVLFSRLFSSNPQSVIKAAILSKSPSCTRMSMSLLVLIHG